MQRHVVILPYYCEEEIDRYCKIADWMLEHCERPLDCQFLLAASPRTEISKRLADSFSRVADCISMQCPTRVFGYPEGPTAMFWDAMDYVADSFRGNGFALWFESDMVPASKTWLNELEADWDQSVKRPLLMGCYVPHVYKFRWLRQKKLMLQPHINGGACYSLDFVRHMPQEARKGVFDMVVYEHARRLGGARLTDRIGFSTNRTIRRDLLRQGKSILHGFMQDKDRFVNEALRPVSESEQGIAGWRHALEENLEDLQRRMRVVFVRKGPRVMLENMLLEQKKVAAGRIPVDHGLRTH